MADKNQKAKKTLGVTNTERPNHKAWKRRACGRRHKPEPCVSCNKN